MKKELNALATFIDERIATMEKNAKTLTDAAAKTAAEESLNQLRTLKRSLNDLGEDDPDSIERLRKDVTDALERIDKRMNEFADEIKALQERVGSSDGNPDGEGANNRLNGDKKAQNYLGSAEATHDFLSAMRASKNAAEFGKNWGARLAENGITIAEGSEDAFLPDDVKGAIEDAWEKPGNWLNRLNNTGAKAFTVRLNTSDQNAETSRAKGHQKGAQKVNESLTFAAKKITPQMVYKKIDIDNQTVFEDDGSLLNYVVKELVDQWLVEIERAILVGDGREDSDANKITNVEAVTEADATYVTTFTHSADNQFIDELVQMVDSIKNDEGGRITVFMSQTTLSELRRFVFGDGSSAQYVRKEDMADQLGVSEIITTSLLGTGVKAIAMRLDKYVTVGRRNPAFVEWENYDTNVRNYRVENPFGGALGAPKSAAVLTIE
jgi:HK97 family phage major capsid protein